MVDLCLNFTLSWCSYVISTSFNLQTCLPVLQGVSNFECIPGLIQDSKRTHT